jgi:hypothetical protein
MPIAISATKDENTQAEAHYPLSPSRFHPEPVRKVLLLAEEGDSDMFIA